MSIVKESIKRGINCKQLLIHKFRLYGWFQGKYYPNGKIENSYIRISKIHKKETNLTQLTGTMSLKIIPGVSNIIIRTVYLNEKNRNCRTWHR